MHIGIDGNEANLKERVGVNVYAFELLKSFRKLQNIWEEKIRFTIYLKSQPREDMPPESDRWKYKVIPGHGLWIMRKLTPHLLFSKDKPDLFFTPSHYVPPITTMPRICSIMDLGYLEFSGQFKPYDYWQLRLWSAYSIMVSKYIISISNATKQSIIQHYPHSKKKIEVIPLAYDKEIFNKKTSTKEINSIKKKYTKGSDYILFLSTLKPSKNIEGLIKAWSKVQSNFPNVKLAIAGKKGWLYESIFQMTKDLDISNRVIFTGFIPETDKPALIAGAKIFILPSFWEGFGLDVLNAFAKGTPVICSNRGSLPEVAGKAAVLVDPKNEDGISQAISSVLTMNKKRYNGLIEKGFAQAAGFSWENTAKKTLEVFNKALSK